MNGAGWRRRHNKSHKPQASRRSQAPIFRQQATSPQATSYQKKRSRPQAPSNKPQAPSRKNPAARLQNLETNGKCPERGGFAGSQE